MKEIILLLYALFRRVSKKFKVIITGYADRTGDAGYVRALFPPPGHATRDAVQRADAATVGVGSDIIPL